MQNETFMTYLATKVPFGIGAAFTASVVSTLWVPKKLKRRGAVAAGVIIGGTSVGASFAFGGLLAAQLGLDPKVIDVGVGVGALIGLFAVAVVNWLANFFEKREDKDLMEVAKEVK